MRATFARLPIRPRYRRSRVREGAQRLEVVRVTARDDDDVGVRRQLGSRDPGRDVFGDDRRSTSGKRSRFANFSRSSTTWTSKADRVRQRGELGADMAGADHVQLGRRLDRLDVHVHLPAAHEAGLLGEVVGQLIVHELRLARRDGLARLPERVVFVAAAADGADHPSIAEHEHLGADALRRRAGGRDDRDERRRFAAIQRVGDGREYFFVHARRLYGVCSGRAGWGRSGRWAVGGRWAARCRGIGGTR